MNHTCHECVDWVDGVDSLRDVHMFTTSTYSIATVFVYRLALFPFRVANSRKYSRLVLREEADTSEDPFGQTFEFFRKSLTLLCPPSLSISCKLLVTLLKLVPFEVMEIFLLCVLMRRCIQALARIWRLGVINTSPCTFGVKVKWRIMVGDQ